MPIWMGVMYFRQGAHGWREVWYQDGSVNAEDALETLTAVRNVRDRGTGINTVIWRHTVSDITIPGDSRSVTVAFEGIPSGQGAGKQSDIAQAAWLLRVECSDVVRRSMWLRGMPDVWFSMPDALFDPSRPERVKALRDFTKAYQTVLQQTGWGVYGYAQNANTRAQNVVTINREPGVPNRILITLPAGATMPLPGQKVRLLNTRFEGGIKINGTQITRSVAGQTITAYARSAVPLIYRGGGKLRIEERAVARVRSIQIIRPGSRATGTTTIHSSARRKRKRIV